MPYGYGLFPHDTQITENVLSTVLKQVDAINSRDRNVVMLMHKPLDSNIVADVFGYRQYKHLQNFYWHKDNYMASGPTNRFMSSVEMGTFAHWPNSNGTEWYGSNIPTERHNFIECKSVTTLAKNIHGNPINVTEKPPAVSAFFLSKYVPKGHTACIIGPGAGGEVIGAAMSGLNVIGVEVDKDMFDGLRGRLNKLVAEQKIEIEKKRLEREKESKSLEKELKYLSEGLTDAKQDTTVSMCVECGEKCTADNVYTCEDCDNEDRHHHDCLFEFADESKESKFTLVCGKCRKQKEDRGEMQLMAAPEGGGSI